MSKHFTLLLYLLSSIILVVPQLAFAECKMNGEVVPCEQVKGTFMVMGGIAIAFALIGIGLFIQWLLSLIHCLSNPVNNKLIWVLVIIFVGPIGSLLYHFIERKRFRAQTKQNNAS